MTLEEFFTIDYQGAPFVHFSAPHLIAIALVVVSSILVAVIARSSQPNSQLRPFLRHGLAIFALLNMLAWQFWQLWAGTWTVAYSLPLHVCTFSNVLCALMLWSRSYRMFEVLYFWGMAGVTQALLTPDIGRFGFPHFVFIIFFTSHGVIPASVAFMMAAKAYRPYWSSVGRVTLITLGFLGFVGVVNWLTGGNYMFVARTPEFPSLIDLLGPWPWYIIGMVGVGVIAFIVVYMPFAVRDWLVLARRPLRAKA